MKSLTKLTPTRETTNRGTKMKMHDKKELIDILNGFQSGDDNVKIDQSQSNALILNTKMALLLESSVYNGNIVNYLKCKGTEYILPCVEDQGWAMEYHKLKNESVCHELRFRICKDDPEATFGIKVLVGRNLNNGSINWLPDTNFTKGYLHHLTLFRLFNYITPYKSIKATAHFFGVQPLPFAPINTGLHMFRSTIFFDTTESDARYWTEQKKMYPCYNEATLIERDLRDIIANKPDQECDTIYSSVIEHHFKQVFDYKDRNGLTIMKMIKKFDYNPTGVTKSYIPLTQWMKHGDANDRLLTMPLPKEQPLYNLDLIEDADYVVICPNLDIADQLQRQSRYTNVVFTSFVCDSVNQVDFSPIRERQIVLLVMNHSGLALEDVYLDAFKLYKHLAEHEKIKEESLCIIQAAVRFYASNQFSKLGDYMKDRRDHHKPEIEDGSLKLIESKEEFDAVLEDVKATIAKRQEADIPFWRDKNAASETPDVPVMENKCGEELVRNLIYRGEITFINGAKGIGKSNLITSLCASMVNPSMRKKIVFPERWWTCCKCDVGSLKVVHLDFENGKAVINDRMKIFAAPYLPDINGDIGECRRNYIVKDMLNEASDLSDVSNYGHLCELLDDIKDNDGTPGQDIDVLVIDTYSGFVNKRDNNYDSILRLRKDYPNMAIVVLHHLNDRGTMRGNKAKGFSASVILKMERPGVDAATLETPFNISFEESPRHHILQQDLAPFKGVFKEGLFVVDMEDAEYSENKSLHELYDAYKKSGKTKSEIAALLGMCESSLENKLKQA